MKIKSRIVLLIVLSFIFACGGGGSDNGGAVTPAPTPPSTANGLTITGTFAQVERSSVARAVETDPSPIKKVIVFGPEKASISPEGAGFRYQRTIATVNPDGTFAVDVTENAPVGVIMVGANDEYLGYLRMEGGVTALPLDLFDSSTSTIDLGTLTSDSEGAITPSNDPLVTTLSLSDSEIASLASISSAFASTVKSPDVDGNGIIDFLEDVSYPMSLGSIFDAGSFNGLNAEISGVHLSSNIIGFGPPMSYQPESATVIGPAGSPFENPLSLTVQVADADTGRYSYYVNVGTELLTGGTYTFEGIPGQPLTYFVEQQSVDNVIVIVPWVTLNADGTIETINWSYKLADGSDAINPTDWIKLIHINMSDYGPGIPTIFAYPTDNTIDVTDKKINWSEQAIVSMGYTDIYENFSGFNYIK